MMNNIIIAALLAWLFTQIVKAAYGLIKYGNHDRSRILWRVVWAGGMPSVHSAVITSTTLTILMSSGPHSLIFGLSLVMSCIVIYDRIRMYSIYRRFQEKYPDLGTEVQKDPLLTDLVGHRIHEIIVGVFIGTVVGIGLSMS